MVRAFTRAGHISAQEPQSTQSSAETAMRNRRLGSVLEGTVSRPLASSGFRRKGRITAWGHTVAHQLHWMQFSGCQTGISTAMPRFSKAEVPEGTFPVA